MKPEVWLSWINIKKKFLFFTFWNANYHLKLLIQLFYRNKEKEMKRHTFLCYGNEQKGDKTFVYLKSKKLI